MNTLNPELMKTFQERLQAMGVDPSAETPNYPIEAVCADSVPMSGNVRDKVIKRSAVDKIFASLRF